MTIKKKKVKAINRQRLEKEANMLCQSLKVEITETKNGIKRALKEKKITQKEFLGLEKRLKKVEEQYRKYKLPKVKK